MPPAAPKPPPSLFAVALVFELGLAVFAVVLGLLLSTDPLETVDVNLQGLLAGVLATLPLLVVFAITWKWPIGPFRSIRAKVETLLVPGLRTCSVAELALISIAAGVGEEFLFRGVVQGALTEPMGVISALLFASLVFGLAHAVTVSYAVLAGLMSVYLGWIWIETGNLVAPITCHALYDFVALWVLTRSAPPTPPAPPSDHASS